jgi:hypothetical protein
VNDDVGLRVDRLVGLHGVQPRGFGRDHLVARVDPALYESHERRGRVCRAPQGKARHRGEVLLDPLDHLLVFALFVRAVRRSHVPPLLVVEMLRAGATGVVPDCIAVDRLRVESVGGYSAGFAGVPAERARIAWALGPIVPLALRVAVRFAAAARIVSSDICPRFGGE